MWCSWVSTAHVKNGTSCIELDGRKWGLLSVVYDNSIASVEQLLREIYWLKDPLDDAFRGGHGNVTFWSE